MKILGKIISSNTLIILMVLIIPLMLVAASFIGKDNVNTFGKENNWNEKIESTKNSLLLENNSLICDSKTGICGPPPGWYTKNNE